MAPLPNGLSTARRAGALPSTRKTSWASGAAHSCDDYSGNRHVLDMLRLHFSGVNHKKVDRLYSAANLAVRKRKNAKRSVSERVPLQLARTVNRSGACTSSATA